MSKKNIIVISIITFLVLIIWIFSYIHFFSINKNNKNINKTKTKIIKEEKPININIWNKKHNVKTWVNKKVIVKTWVNKKIVKKQNNNKNNNEQEKIKELYIKNSPANSIVDIWLIKCFFKWWIKDWFKKSIKVKFWRIYKKVKKYNFKYYFIKNYNYVYKNAREIECNWYWIKNLKWLNKFNYLEKIDFSWNKIEEIPKYIFINYDSTWQISIEDLWLKWNKILWSLADEFSQWENNRKIWQLIDWNYVWIVTKNDAKIWAPIYYFYWDKKYIFNKVFSFDLSTKFHIKELWKEINFSPQK